MNENQRNALRLCHVNLVRDLEPKYVLDVLYEDEILTDNDLELIKAEKSARGRCQLLLSILPTRGPSAYGSFQRALRKTNYTHLGDILERMKETEDGNVIKVSAPKHRNNAFNSTPLENRNHISNDEQSPNMGICERCEKYLQSTIRTVSKDSNFLKVLQNLCCIFIHNIEPRELIDDFFQNVLLSDDQCERVRVAVTRRDRCETFFKELVKENSDDVLTVLVNSLRKKYAYIVSDIENIISVKQTSSRNETDSKHSKHEQLQTLTKLKVIEGHGSIKKLDSQRFYATNYTLLDKQVQLPHQLREADKDQDTYLKVTAEDETDEYKSVKKTVETRSDQYTAINGAIETDSVQDSYIKEATDKNNMFPADSIGEHGELKPDHLFQTVDVDNRVESMAGKGETFDYSSLETSNDRKFEARCTCTKYTRNAKTLKERGNKTYCVSTDFCDKQRGSKTNEILKDMHERLPVTNCCSNGLNTISNISKCFDEQDGGYMLNQSKNTPVNSRTREPLIEEKLDENNEKTSKPVTKRVFRNRNKMLTTKSNLDMPFQNDMIENATHNPQISMRSNRTEEYKLNMVKSVLPMTKLGSVSPNEPSKRLSFAFNYLSTLINEGKFDKFEVLSQRLQKRYHTDYDMLCIVGYLKTSRDLFETNFDSAKQNLNSTMEIVPKTSNPRYFTLELYTAKTRMYITQKKLEKLQTALDDAMMILETDPVGCSGRAAGWLYINDARNQTAKLSVLNLSKSNALKVYEQLYERAKTSFKRAMTNFKNDGGKDGPFGFGYALCRLVILLLRCGDNGQTMNTLNPLPEDIDAAEQYIKNLEDSEIALAKILEMHLRLAKCDYYFRRENNTRALENAETAYQLASELKLLEFTEHAHNRLRFLQSRTKLTVKEFEDEEVNKVLFGEYSETLSSQSD